MNDIFIPELKKLPLTEFGRRVLVRQALVSTDGRTGVQELAWSLHEAEITVWKLIKGQLGDGWYDKYFDMVARLCLLLKCDHSWLHGVIDYGVEGRIEFELRKREAWR